MSSVVVNPKNGKAAGMISKGTYDVVQANDPVLHSTVVYDHNFHYNW